MEVAGPGLSVPTSPLYGLYPKTTLSCILKVQHSCLFASAVGCQYSTTTLSKILTQMRAEQC